ncbi:hypothetical protein G9A89_007130 [Geosiphon pyriformis]|nr:hypothetical protein G9A89_007130 [Geosiphon pyriformis]
MKPPRRHTVDNTYSDEKNHDTVFAENSYYEDSSKGLDYLRDQNLIALSPNGQMAAMITRENRKIMAFKLDPLDQTSQSTLTKPIEPGFFIHSKAADYSLAISNQSDALNVFYIVISRSGIPSTHHTKKGDIFQDFGKDVQFVRKDVQFAINFTSEIPTFDESVNYTYCLRISSDKELEIKHAGFKYGGIVKFTTESEILIMTRDGIRFFELEQNKKITKSNRIYGTEKPETQVHHPYPASLYFQIDSHPDVPFDLLNNCVKSKYLFALDSEKNIEMYNLIDGDLEKVFHPFLSDNKLSNSDSNDKIRGYPIFALWEDSHESKATGIATLMAASLGDDKVTIYIVHNTLPVVTRQFEFAEGINGVIRFLGFFKHVDKEHIGKENLHLAILVEGNDKETSETEFKIFMWDLCKWKETREFGNEIDMKLFKKGQQLPIIDSARTTVILDETGRLLPIIQSEEAKEPKKTYPNFIPIADFFKQLSASEGSQKISMPSKRPEMEDDIKMSNDQSAHTMPTDIKMPCGQRAHTMPTDNLKQKAGHHIEMSNDQRAHTLPIDNDPKQKAGHDIKRSDDQRAHTLPIDNDPKHKAVGLIINPIKHVLGIKGSDSNKRNFEDPKGFKLHSRLDFKPDPFDKNRDILRKFEPWSQISSPDPELPKLTRLVLPTGKILRLFIGHFTIQIWLIEDPQKIFGELKFIWSLKEDFWEHEKEVMKSVELTSTGPDQYEFKISLKKNQHPISVHFQIEPNETTAINAIKTLKFLVSKRDELPKNLARDFSFIIKETTLIIESFLKDKPEIWRFLDLHYGITQQLIKMKCYEVVEKILDKDHRNSCFHIPRSTNFHTSALEEAINSGNISLLRNLLNYYSTNGNHNLGWMTTISEALPDLFRTYPGKFQYLAVDLFSKPVFSYRKIHIDKVHLSDISLNILKGSDLHPFTYSGNFLRKIKEIHPRKHSPFYEIVDNDRKGEIFENPAMEAIIEYEWRAQKTGLFHIKAIFYWIYLLFFLVWSKLYLDVRVYGEDNEDFIRKASYVILWVAFLSIQMTFWFLVSVVFIAGCFAYTMYLLLHYAPKLGVNPGSPTYTNIQNGNNTNSTIDLTQIINPYDYTDNYYSEFWKSLEAVYFWVNGRWDQIDQWNFWPIDIISLMASIILVTIMQNMLIALMSNAYDSARERSRRGLLQTRTRMILEADEIKTALVFIIHVIPGLSYLPKFIPRLKPFLKQAHYYPSFIYYATDRIEVVTLDTQVAEMKDQLDKILNAIAKGNPKNSIEF